MNKFKKIFICLLFSSVSLLANAKSPYHSVEEMLVDQDIIRIYLDDTQGFGNQAASINLMNRLWEMNFHGTYELIYSDYSDEDVDKVIKLFNLPQHLPKTYYYEDTLQRKITFIAMSKHMDNIKHHRITQVKLGMTGGREVMTGPCMYKDEISPYCPPYSNPAKLMNADVYINMQPWFAKAHKDGVLTQKSMDLTFLTPPGKYLVYPSANFVDVKNYLTEDANGRELITQKPALKVLVDGILQNQYNLLVVYGYPFTKENTRTNTNLDYLSNMMQVIAGSKYAMIHGTDAMKKPLVIAVFYDYKKEANELAQLITKNNWGEYEFLGGEQMRAAIIKLGLNNPSALVTTSLDDVDASVKLNNLQHEQILLLSMGVLPKTVFDGIFSYQGENAWPAIREGEGTLNMLITQGKPQLRCVEKADTKMGDSDRTKWEPLFESVKDPTLHQRFQDFYGENGFCAHQVWINSPNIYEAVGNFLIEGNEQQSSFSRYFQTMREEAKKPEHDRIYRALEVALKLL